jgi:putative adhesin
MQQLMRSRMRLISLAGLAAAAALTAGCHIDAHSQIADGSFDRTLSVKDGVVDLDVQSRSGQIDIRPGKGGEVRIVGRIRAYESIVALGAGYTPEEQVKSLSSTPPIRQSGNSISVGEIDTLGLGTSVSISYEVTVPADTRVHTSSRSGNQTIEGIGGPVDASSRSGSIRVERVGGDVEIESRSGRVDVGLLPDGAHLDVATRSGAIDTGAPAQAEREARRRGDPDRRRRHVNDTIGQGRRRVVVETRSGAVRIRRDGAILPEAPAPSTSEAR